MYPMYPQNVGSIHSWVDSTLHHCAVLWPCSYIDSCREIHAVLHHATIHLYTAYTSLEGTVPLERNKWRWSMQRARLAEPVIFSSGRQCDQKKSQNVYKGWPKSNKSPILVTLPAGFQPWSRGCLSGQAPKYDIGREGSDVVVRQTMARSTLCSNFKFEERKWVYLPTYGGKMYSNSKWEKEKTVFDPPRDSRGTRLGKYDCFHYWNLA